MNSFRLEVLASDKPFYEGECISLVIPTTQGQYGIQAMHSNAICAIIPGTLKFTLPSGERVIAAVSQGIAKVENNMCFCLWIQQNIPRKLTKTLQEERRRNQRRQCFKREAFRIITPRR